MNRERWKGIERTPISTVQPAGRNPTKTVYGHVHVHVNVHEHLNGPDDHQVENLS